MNFYLPCSILVISLFCAYNENCFGGAYNTQHLFYLELIEASTGKNFFLGNDTIFPLDSFQLYRMQADTFSEYTYQNFEEHPFFVINCRYIYI